MDYGAVNLHTFMGGHGTEVMEFLCGAAFQKVECAVAKLRESVPSKRTRSEERFPRPSDYGKDPSSYQILDHRSSCGSHGLACTQACGCTLLVTSLTPDHQIDPKYFRVAASTLKAMSRFFKTEQDRQNVFLEEVQDLFPPPKKVSSGRAITDTTIQAAMEACILNWKFKNELSGISTEPVAQNNAYFVHLQREVVSRAPMLLATVVGCHYFRGSLGWQQPVC